MAANSKMIICNKDKKNTRAEKDGIKCKYCTVTVKGHNEHRAHEDKCKKGNGQAADQAFDPADAQAADAWNAGAFHRAREREAARLAAIEAEAIAAGAGPDGAAGAGPGAAAGGRGAGARGGRGAGARGGRGAGARGGRGAGARGGRGAGARGGRGAGARGGHAGGVAGGPLPEI